MDRFFKLFSVLILTITCHFLGTASGASLFGINFDAPKNVIRKGVEKIPQIIDQITFLNQNSKEKSVTQDSSLQNHHDNDFNFNQDPLIPQEGPYFINDVTTRKNQNVAFYNQKPDTGNTQGISNDKQDSRHPISKTDEIYNQGPVAAKNQESFYDKEDSRPMTDADEKYIWGVVDDTVTPYDTEHTTTSDEWTTTDSTEALNRIGTNPAVVASILG